MDFIEIKKTDKKKYRIIYGIFGFLLGASPIVAGVMPFGCAFLCAIPKKGRREAFFGVALASLFDKSILLSLFCAFFVFTVMTLKERNGGLYFYHRILLSLSVSALKTAYIILNGIETMPDVFKILASVISYPAFTLAFMGFFDKKKDLHPKRYDISLLAFAFSLTSLLGNFEISNASLGLIPACAFTLCAARTKGFAFGGVCGIVCGLALGGAEVGALGVLGMSYGLLVNEIEPLALVLSFMLALTGRFYLSGAYGFVSAGIMMLIVFSAFIPLRKNLAVYKHSVSVSDKKVNDRRLSRYASAFSSLSALFYTVSDTTKEENITDINQKIVKAVDYYCQRCEGCNLEKSEISNFFTSELRRYGVSAYSRIPLHISEICPNACAMAKAVNNLREIKEKDGEKGLKQMAEEYSTFSSLLVDASKKQEESVRVDKPLGQEIMKALINLGVECDGVKVKGTRVREITVFGVNPRKMSQNSDEIQTAISKLVKTALTVPEFIPHEGYFIMRLRSIPSLKVEFSKISEAKNGESVCGDTVSVFENEDNYFYCLVSDGMGSGRDAALTSRLSSIMMEKLLAVGASTESALRLLNKALAEKEEEVFATVDLLEVDRVRSVASLIKAGAAPTILIRGERMVVLEAKTPPAGIMKKVIADKKTIKIEKGDMIVMLSDGILQTGSENSHFPNNRVAQNQSARSLATQIIESARNNSAASDDMSVCVLRFY